MAFAWSLTLTDIATGSTELRTVRTGAARHVFVALVQIQGCAAVPAAGHRLGQRQRVHQRAPAVLVPAAADHLHPVPAAEQERWLPRRAEELGQGPPHRRLLALRRPGEIELLNRIWPALSPLINLFTPQQKLISKTRVGAKVTKRYDQAQTPHQRLLTHAASDPHVLDEVDARRLATQLRATNPAAARREVARPCATLLERVRRKSVTRLAKANRAYLSDAKPNAPTAASS